MSFIFNFSKKKKKKKFQKITLKFKFQYCKHYNITFNHKDYLKRKKKHLYHKENKNLLQYLIGERFIPPTKMRLFVGGTNLSPIRYCLLWDRQGRPLLPPTWICSISHQRETPPTLAL